MSLVRQQPVFGILLNEFPNDSRQLRSVGCWYWKFTFCGDRSTCGKSGISKDKAAFANQAFAEVNRSEATVNEHTPIIELTLDERSVVKFDLMAVEGASSVGLILLSRCREKWVKSFTLDDRCARQRHVYPFPKITSNVSA